MRNHANSLHSLGRDNWSEITGVIHTSEPPPNMKRNHRLENLQTNMTNLVIEITKNMNGSCQEEFDILCELKGKTGGWEGE